MYEQTSISVQIAQNYELLESLKMTTCAKIVLVVSLLALSIDKEYRKAIKQTEQNNGHLY